MPQFAHFKAVVSRLTAYPSQYLSNHPQSSHVSANRFHCIYHVIAHRFAISRIACVGIFLCSGGGVGDGKPAFNRQSS